MEHRQIEECNIAERYVMGHLSDSNRAEFEMHFIDCSECLEAIEEIRELRRGLLVAGAHTSKRPARRTFPLLHSLNGSFSISRLAAAAAALALLFAVAAYLFIENRRLSRTLEELRSASLPRVQAARAPETISTTDRSNANGITDNKNASQSASRKNQPSEPVAGAVQVNTPIFVLSSVRDSADRSNDIVISPAADWFVLTLELERAPQYKTYRATIKSAPANRTVWIGGNLIPNRYDSLTLGFGSSFFHPGEYSLALDGIPDQGPPVPVANFPFRVIKKK